MAVQISAFPPVPLLTDTPEVFDPKAVNFNLFLANTFVSEANALANEAEANVTAASNSASAAQTAQTASELAQDLSEDARDLSLGYRNESETFKNQAQAAVATLPEGTINDVLTQPDTAWSSQKIDAELALKRDLTNNSFPRYDVTTSTLGGTGTVTFDVSIQQTYRHAVTGTRTFVFSNPPASTRATTLVLNLYDPSLPSRTINWPAGIIWDAGLTPEFRGTEVVVVFFWNGANWFGTVGVDNA